MAIKMLPAGVAHCGMCPYFAFIGRSAQEPDKKLYACRYRNTGVESSLIWTVPVAEEATYTIPESCPLSSAPEGVVAVPVAGADDVPAEIIPV